MSTPRRLLIALISIGLMLLSACSTTKYVEEGQMLLSQVKIRLDSTAKADQLRAIELMPYISQKPNTKLFGRFNWGLGIYNLSRRGSQAWLSRRLRAWGEAPSIYNPQETAYSVGSLSSALYNMGYLDAEVSTDLDTIANKQVRLNYKLNLGHLYRISKHEEHIKDPIIYALLHPTDSLVPKRDFPSEQYRSLVDSGARLSPNLMQGERKRISQILRNRGHWGFREEQIHFDVDTTAGYERAWLRTVIDTTSTIYHIGQVVMRHRATQASPLAPRLKDTIGGIAYDIDTKQRLRPKFLDSRIWIRPKEVYSQDMIARTYATLSDIAAIRTTNISYSLDSTAQVPTLDVLISTEAERSKEFTADLVGTHSGGNFGAIASVTFQHNNIFGGAEQLRISSNIGYEELRSASRNHLSYGLEANLSFPKLIMPSRSHKQRMLKGATDISLSYSYLTRPEFKRNLLSSAWAYNWLHYRYPAFRYTFKLLEVDYMHFGYMDERFLSTVPDYDRMLNYRNQLILSTSFSLSYNSANDYRLSSSPFLHSLRLHLQSAGNLLMAYSKLTGAKRDNFGAYTFGGVNIVQFFRGELDYSGLYRLGGKNALAYHCGISAVVPYGNSSFLPIDLRYFSGGASSLRAWGARSLGPGSMRPTVGTSIFHQVGDIKLDLSAELRLRFAPSWEFALFSDAGNVWTIRHYREQPGGDFKFNRFYKEIAWSTGVGLRWDFDYFLLRLDAGLKLYAPQAEQGKRWVLGKLPLRDMVGIHFALGYPF